MKRASGDNAVRKIERPLIIIGAPRSGTTILFRCLALHQQLWHLRAESHAIFEGPLHPALRNYDSNRATANMVDDEISAHVHTGFLQRVMNPAGVTSNAGKLLSGRTLSARIRNRFALKRAGRISRRSLPASVQILEKTPKNSLRISALNRIFPDARFLVLSRDVRENIDSLIAGWNAVDRIGPYKRHRFAGAGYPIANELNFKDYDGPKWKFALVPGWRKLAGRTTVDAAALQYFACNAFAEHDLAQIDSDRVFRVGFADFVASPVDHLRSIFAWLNLSADAAACEFAAQLPRVNDTRSSSETGLRRPRDVERILNDGRWQELADDLVAQEAHPSAPSTAAAVLDRY